MHFPLVCWFFKYINVPLCKIKQNCFKIQSSLIIGWQNLSKWIAKCKFRWRQFVNLQIGHPKLSLHIPMGKLCSDYSPQQHRSVIRCSLILIIFSKIYTFTLGSTLYSINDWLNLIDWRFTPCLRVFHLYDGGVFQQ